MQHTKSLLTKFSLFAVYWGILIFMATTPRLAAQEEVKQEKPFSCEEILKLLANKADQNQIIEQIKRIKVDCKLTIIMTSKLVKAGASDALLEAIEKYSFVEFYIVSPKSGAEVGATLKVEGKSKSFTGNYLWLFAHREGLSVWWPQGGSVKLKENGEWAQGVFIGGPQDIGFDFEIKAIWVDEKTDRRLKDYLAEGEKTGNFPGIPLPEGSPIAEVTVRKVRH